MKIRHGIYLPETDTHFDTMLSGGADLVHGKGTYQLKKYRAALKYVKNKGLAVDIGGHVGLWSRVMSYDFVLVIAFEPIAIHRQCFELNCKGLGNVQLNAMAIAETVGELHFNMPIDNTGHTHVANEGESCQSAPLDSIILGAAIDFLKIDVEGFELQVVKGAEQTIRRDRPTIIIEQKPNNAENYGTGRWDAVNLLKSWGAIERQVISGDHILSWD